MSISQKQLKTCLRYPGGKSRATKTLAPWYPENFKEYREPFIGGGSVAIYITKKYPNVDIWVNDLYAPLYNFWIQLRNDGENLSEKLKEIKTKVSDFQTQDLKDKAHKELFDRVLIDINNQDGLERAVSFFILNKCSFSGLTENSTFSPTASRSNFSFIGIEKLKEYSKLIKDWKITNTDYSEVMNADGNDVFVFLDPPYDIKDFLYGKNREMHKSFDHDLFAENVYKCPHNFMITYNVNEKLLELYKNYYIREWELRYSMAHRGEKGTKENVKVELLITNYPIEKVATLENFFKKSKIQPTFGGCYNYNKLKSEGLVDD
jgi:DNA adenine methylase